MRARLLGIALLAGCSGSGGTDEVGETDDVERCPRGGFVHRVTGGFGSRSEGIAIAPDGTAYVAGAHGLMALRPGEDPRLVVPLPEPGVGVAWWRGAAWVALFGDDDTPGRIVEVVPGGGVTEHEVPEIAKPNFLTPTPWGTLLVSDDFDTRIFEWDDGEVRVWLEDIPSPNGMAFSPDGGTLYVASTFKGEGLRGVEVVDGEAGAVTLLAELPRGSTPDGVAVAEDGSVLVALNIAQDIVRWKPGSSEVETIVDEVATPASLAFGRGDWPACSVIVTNLFGDDIHEVGVGVRGFFPPWAE